LELVRGTNICYLRHLLLLVDKNFLEFLEWLALRNENKYFAQGIIRIGANLFSLTGFKNCIKEQRIIIKNA
jgi:hypothetical protein